MEREVPGSKAAECNGKEHKVQRQLKGSGIADNPEYAKVGALVGVVLYADFPMSGRPP